MARIKKKFVAGPLPFPEIAGANNANRAELGRPIARKYRAVPAHFPPPPPLLPSLLLRFYYFKRGKSHRRWRFLDQRPPVRHQIPVALRAPPRRERGAPRGERVHRLFVRRLQALSSRYLQSRRSRGEKETAYRGCTGANTLILVVKGKESRRARRRCDN